MKLRAVVMVIALALGVQPGANALEAPEFSAKDHRVRYVNYDDADVIQLDAVIGVATHIQLEEGESLVYHVFGDSDAYEFTHKDNHVFFKPIQEQADTNLTLITNRRSYAFRVSYFNDRQSKALYKLVIRYPDTAAKLSAAQAEQAAVRHALANTRGQINWATYTKSGDMGLAPVHAWDDGKHTWMQFAAQTDLPAIYLVGADGQEVITNYHMADSQTVVLHRTAPTWHLRLGNRVTAIRNGGFGQINMPLQDTGTVSAHVSRVLRGEPPPEPVATTTPDARDTSKRQFRFDETLHSRAEIATDATAFKLQGQPIDIPGVSEPASPRKPAPPQSQTAAAAATKQGDTTDKPNASNSVTSNSPPSVRTIGKFKIESGDETLMPIKIWIDGKDTLFQFAKRDTPVIVPLDATGKEQLAGLRVDPNNVIVMHTTAERWTLRDGSRTLTLVASENAP